MALWHARLARQKVDAGSVGGLRAWYSVLGGLILLRKGGPNRTAGGIQPTMEFRPTEERARGGMFFCFPFLLFFLSLGCRQGAFFLLFLRLRREPKRLVWWVPLYRAADSRASGLRQVVGCGGSSAGGHCSGGTGNRTGWRRDRVSRLHRFRQSTPRDARSTLTSCTCARFGRWRTRLRRPTLVNTIGSNHHPLHLGESRWRRVRSY